ncbi:MAG: nitrous oxide-stimulated promoter family protein, partial [Thermoguttaceae bacterium]|nr:nitrous oxide-stimulated promoter family protein [Thermoguttaceae bacterium]
MRERIRAVMRFSGPRMMLRHPLLALRHQIDSIRSSTERDVPPSQPTAGR